METSSQHRAYSREEWGSLSIQERIRAMNGTVDLEDTQQQMSQDSGASEEQQEHAMEDSFQEPPRRASVVEMWRRRDNKQSTLEGDEGSRSNGLEPIEKTRNEEEEKKDDEQKDEPPSNHGTVKPSQARSLWSQRANTASQVRSPVVKMIPKKVTLDSSATAATEANVDLTIVPSPSKPPHLATKEEGIVVKPAAASRPTHIADFWARRGLQPISSKNGDTVTKSASAASSPWKTSDAGSYSSVAGPKDPLPDVKKDDVAAPRVSVVDRWKQRVLAPEEDETPEPPAPKKPIAERWKEAVKKPEAQPPKPRSKVSDRWLNRQQNEKEQSSRSATKLPPKVRTGGVSIPAFLASSASHNQTTARTSGSSRTETTVDEDETATAGESSLADDSHQSGHVEDTERTLTLTPKGSSHVTKRWSNRVGSEDSPSISASPAADSGHLRAQSSPSLPIPRRKTIETQHDDSTHKSPQADNQLNGTNSGVPTVRAPDPKTFLPDLRLSAPAASTSRLGPTPAVTKIQGTPLTPVPAIGKVHESRLKVSPKLQYEQALRKTGHSGVADFDDGDSDPKLVVLISGQSLSRGQLSTNQQIATILNGHGIPYEEIDGSILSVRDRRNELFKISGLWAQYPQFFLKEEGELAFWGTWDTLEQCNDAGKIVEEFAPERLHPAPKKRIMTEEPAEKTILSLPKQAPVREHSDSHDSRTPTTDKSFEKKGHLALDTKADGKESDEPSPTMDQIVADSRRVSLAIDKFSGDPLMPTSESLGKDDLFRRGEIDRSPKDTETGVRPVGPSTKEESPAVSTVKLPSPRAKVSGKPEKEEVPWPQSEVIRPTATSVKKTSDTKLQESSRTPSPATSLSGASGSVSSQTSSAMSKRDFQGLKARRIGKRLIEKKKELQAHRQRLKNNRSADSTEAAIPGATVENEQTALSSSDVQIDQTVESGEDPKRGELFQGGTENRTGPPPATSAFSPLNGGAPKRHDLRIATDPPASSPKASAGSPGSEGGLSFLDTPTKSDGDSVVSRSSALSMRAEKVLKQRRQKASLGNVAEDAESSAEERMHAQELTRNVLYGRPDQQKAPQSAEALRRMNHLHLNAMASEMSSPVGGSGSQQFRSQAASENLNRTTPLSEELGEFISPDERVNTSSAFDSSRVNGTASPLSTYSLSRPQSTGTLEGSPSMTRQRASLASRYKTSDRFMDETDLEPVENPTSTKSLPTQRRSRKKAVALDSTRSAPSRRYYDETYSSSDTRDSTPLSSADLHSTSSQTSPARSGLISAPSEMDSRSEGRSNYGINEEFTAKSAYNYDAFRNAYSSMTFGQLAADFAGEMTNALNLEKLQEDVKRAFSKNEGSGASRSQTRKKMVVPDSVPFDEEDVAIEVEYMEPSVIPMPSTEVSFEEPKRGRRRRAAEV